MAEAKHLVTIKGVKDGLVFVIDDACPFADALEELAHKLDKTHRTILAGPVVQVQIKLGKRTVSEPDKQALKQLIGKSGNLLVQSLEADGVVEDATPEPKREGVAIRKGIIRSGQTLEHEGHLLFLGDINPGGTLLCTGDIYVLGALRGMAHAGTGGNARAIVAASFLRPTQLRIADVISRPPDEWGIEDATMEFAYIRDGSMEIDKINQLHRLRPDHPFGNL